MTTKNIQLTIMFALVVMVGIPAFAIADTTPRGNTTVLYEQPVQKVNSVLERLNELEQQKQQAETEAEIADLQARQDRIILEDRETKPVYSEEQTRTMDLAAERLADYIVENRGEFRDEQENFVPFTEIGFYPNDNAIKVGIHQDYVNEVNMERYASIARDILDNGVNIIVYNDGDYGSLDACSTTTSNCSPMEGGIRINIDSQGAAR